MPKLSATTSGAACESRYRVAPSPPTCTPDASLFNRSYALPAAWPFDPIRLVMEERQGTCDLYHDRHACCELHGGEPYVRDAIASLLSGCHRKRCIAIDIGSNTGWMTAYMLSLGAHVVAIEPQTDLAAALGDTARLNCWTDRLIVLNAFACAHAVSSSASGDGSSSRADANAVAISSMSATTSSAATSSSRRVIFQPQWKERFGKDEKSCLAPRPAGGPGAFRLGGGVPRNRYGRMEQVPGVRLEDALWYGLKAAGMKTAGEAAAVGSAGGGMGESGGSGGKGSSSSLGSGEDSSIAFRMAVASLALPLHLSFLKLDGDGPEPGWLDTFEQLLSSTRHRLSVDAVSVEHTTHAHGLNARTLRLLQSKHGFDVYRLAADDRRRLMTPAGWDLYSPEGSIAPIGHVRGSLQRDALETEVLRLRALERVYRIRRGLSESQWQRILTPIPEPSIHYHVMELLLVHRRVKLVEPMDSIWLSRSTISAEARAANFSGEYSAPDE